MQNSSQARQHIDRFLEEYHLRFCMNKVQRLRLDEVQRLRMDEVQINSWSDRVDRLLTDARSKKSKNAKPRKCGKGWTGTKPPGCKRAIPAKKKTAGSATGNKRAGSRKRTSAAPKPCGKGWIGTNPPGCRRMVPVNKKTGGKGAESQGSGSYSVVEDKKTLTKLTKSWNDKLRAYDAIVQAPRGERALEAIAYYRNRIDQDFTASKVIPTAKLTFPIPDEARRRYTAGISKKEALSVLDDMEAKHRKEIELNKQQIKDSGIDPQRLNMERVRDNHMISELLLGMVSAEGRKMIGVVTGDNKLQALLNWEEEKNSVYIELLATAPQNLDPQDPNRTKGGGTRAIVAAIRKSQDIGKGGAVSLTPLSGAESFYEGLGFKWKKDGITLMLNKDDAEKVLRKYGKQ